MVFSCAPNFRAKAAAKKQALKQKLAGAGAYHGVSLRLLLVDRQVDAQDVLPNAALGCVHVVKYDAKETTLAQLVGLIREAHRQNGAPFLSMAIAQHGADAEGQWQWTTDLTVNLKSMHGAIDQLAPVVEVLAAALSKTKAGKAHIDLLACNLATTCKGLVPALEKMYGIDFRASTDETGNDLSGGDWKMETDDDYDVAQDYLDAAKLIEYTETMAEKGGAKGKAGGKTGGSNSNGCCCGSMCASPGDCPTYSPGRARRWSQTGGVGHIEMTEGQLAARPKLSRKPVVAHLGQAQPDAAGKEEHDAEGGDNAASDGFNKKLGGEDAAEGAVSAAWKVKVGEKKGQWEEQLKAKRKASGSFLGAKLEGKLEATAIALVQTTVAMELNKNCVVMSGEALAQVSVHVGADMEMQGTLGKMTAGAHAEAVVKAFLKSEAFAGMSGAGATGEFSFGAMIEASVEFTYTYNDAITLKAKWSVTAIVGAGGKAGFAVRFKDGVCNYACVVAAGVGVGGGIEIELEIDVGKLKALLGDKIDRTFNLVRRVHDNTRKHKQVHPISNPAAATGAGWTDVNDITVQTELNSAETIINWEEIAAEIAADPEIDAQCINMAFWHSIRKV